MNLMIEPRSLAFESSSKLALTGCPQAGPMGFQGTHPTVSLWLLSWNCCSFVSCQGRLMFCLWYCTLPFNCLPTWPWITWSTLFKNGCENQKRRLPLVSFMNNYFQVTRPSEVWVRGMFSLAGETSPLRTLIGKAEKQGSKWRNSSKECQ